MFTGIVESMAEIKGKRDNRLVISRPSSFTDCDIGSSICVSGVCLSIVNLTDLEIEFDVIDETYDKTTLGGLDLGSMVNLERALRADGRFDGHIVQGHIEGRGVCTQNEQGIIKIELSKELIKNCVQKGSIALDGVSLTISNLTENKISVALIPHTLESTSLGKLKIGDSVNIETDIMHRYLQNIAKNQ